MDLKSRVGFQSGQKITPFFESTEVAAMLTNGPPTPPVSGSELRYQHYGLAHLDKAGSKVRYHQNIKNPRTYHTDQESFFQPSTPCLSSPDGQSCQNIDSYFTELSNENFDNLQGTSPGSSSLQLQSALSNESAGEGNGLIFANVWLLSVLLFILIFHH